MFVAGNGDGNNMNRSNTEDAERTASAQPHAATGQIPTSTSAATAFVEAQWYLYDPPLANAARNISIDVEAVWRSDSRGLIVARQPPARKLAQGSALYSIDLATGAATLLVADNGYEQTNLSVNGDLLLFQRVALGDVTARPELWVYHLLTRELRRIAHDGVSPRWLPAPGAPVR